MCLCTGLLPSFTYLTKSRMPPSYRNSCRSSPSRSSTSTMWSPRVRKAVSRRRWISVSVENSSASWSKISESGRKLIVVPVARDLVALAAELPAGVELRHHDRQRRDALLRDHVDGDAAAAVEHRDRAVRMEAHLQVVVVTAEGL